MFRKIFWLLAMVTVAIGVSGIVDLRAANRRRELWSEATD